MIELIFALFATALIAHVLTTARTIPPVRLSLKGSGVWTKIDTKIEDNA